MEQIAEIDDAELGDDPFSQAGDTPAGIDAGNEPWLKSDRDYTYPEVCHPVFTHTGRSRIQPLVAFAPFLRLSSCI